MTALINKINPLTGDVLIIVSDASLSSTRTDLKSDINLFLSAGASVSIALTYKPDSASTSSINELIDFGIRSGCLFLGKGDVFLAKTTIVYSTEELLSDGIEVQFSTDHIAYLIEEPDWIADGAVLEQIITHSETYARRSPIFLGTSNDDLKIIRSYAPDHRCALWNFLNSDKQTTVRQRKPSTEEFWLGSTFDDNNRQLGIDLKKISNVIASNHEARLVLRTALPSRLENPRGGKETVLGFPFVPSSEDEFIASLDSYIMPVSALDSNHWKSEISACLRAGVSLFLPEQLRPIIEDRAYYFKGEITRKLLSDILDNSQPKKRERLGGDIGVISGRNNFGETCGFLGLAKGEEKLDGKLYSTDPSNGGIDPASEVSKIGSGVRDRAVKKVCFVTSNGAGMGHLTRLLAVARRLDPDVAASFISLSQACGVVAEYGYDFEYLPSKGDLKVDGPEWNKYFNRKFLEALDRFSPDVVVFDGTWPYQGISKAVQTYPAEFVWMRRGMWRKEISSTSMVRNPNFSAVIAPGDVAEAYDKGPTQRAIDAYKVDPIIVMDESEVLDRNEARKALALDKDANVMLITLGAGNINKIDDDVAEIIKEVRDLKEPWEILITSPLISNNISQDIDVRSISIYPLAKYAKAFDFVVSATGYNSYHEWLAYKIPTLWIPNLRTITDDQISRAMFAHDNGLGFAVAPDSSMGIGEAVQRLADRTTRSSIVDIMHKYSFDNGAYKAAEHISKMAKDVKR
ncbi:hypothetical protein [Glutamicibacter nicotianae]|uniref:hypothetical protein n=1 Tax=Glutamicibacter nicotianae TaxID=37929 RepID=UPI0013CE6D50|nr:hypothetical protein [Glutamicibacter nicotianae]